ncbi:MAG: 2-oxoacid:acceptor oxidoreductase family protein [Candidatus Glassbacteria bacterium]|nr:2-oxoacid:acceptor oxidoreductase family protein [Candidatus Glassbacteria bacterium]
MQEIRFHGRGGQGAVAAGNVLAASLFSEGKHVQAFPHFGVERRGAPVAAFVRFDDHPVELRCHIYTPDYVIILDPSLAESPSVVEGLKKGGKVLVNSHRGPENFSGLGDFVIATVDASSIALENKLGSIASPIVNTAILGALARFTGIVSLDSVIASVAEFIPVKTGENITAVRQSYDRVVLPAGT